MRATIQIRGAWAELTGESCRVLDDCLSFLHPKRWHSPAFKEKRWDGKVRLYNGNKFPAGLVPKVVGHLNSEGDDVRVVRKAEKTGIDPSRLTPDYLQIQYGGETYPLADHQLDVIRLMLECPGGTIKAVTGSGKTAIMAAAARYFYEERGWRSLIVTSKKGLAVQTVKRLNEYYESDLSVGLCGDGMKEAGVVTVGTAQTMIGFKNRSRKMRGQRQRQPIPANPVLRDLVYNCEVLFLDEAHHTSSATWYDIAMASGALRRYGLSGTPLKDDEISDYKLIGATGPLIHEVNADALIEAGWLAKPKIVMVMAEAASGPPLPKETKIVRRRGRPVQVMSHIEYAPAYDLGVVANEHLNRSVVRTVEWLTDPSNGGKQTMILCRRKDHFRTLDQMLEASGVTHMAVWGDTETSERNRAKESLAQRKIDALLATTIFDEGEDVPSIEALVLAEGVKVPTNALQRIGRGMRRKAGDNDVWIVDFVPTCHPKLCEHALRRCEAYEAEGYDVRIVDQWRGEDDLFGASSDLLPFKTWNDTV